MLTRRQDDNSAGIAGGGAIRLKGAPQLSHVLRPLRLVLEARRGAEPPPAPVAAEPGPPAADPPSPNGAVLPAEPYFAKRGARLFHSRACGWVARIDESERRAFPETGAAQAEGFLPCPACEPLKGEC